MQDIVQPATLLKLTLVALTMLAMPLAKRYYARGATSPAANKKS